MFQRQRRCPTKAAAKLASSSRGKSNVDVGQVTDDMARLALVRKRQEEQRLQRIRDKGFDRYLPPGTPGGPPKGWTG